MRNLLASLATAVVLTACGGSDADPPPERGTIEVAASPTAVTLHAGDSTQLGAHGSVTGLPPGQGTAIYVIVDFALQESAGGSLAGAAANGEDFTVTYTAPSTAGVYHVIASAQADPNIRSVITITVN